MTAELNDLTNDELRVRVEAEQRKSMTTNTEQFRQPIKAALSLSPSTALLSYVAKEVETAWKEGYTKGVWCDVLSQRDARWLASDAKTRLESLPE